MLHRGEPAIGTGEKGNITKEDKESSRNQLVVIIAFIAIISHRMQDR